MGAAVVGEAGEATMPIGCAVPSPDADAGPERRAVAIATGPMELLRPESDLARRLAAFGHVDVLLATDDSLADPLSDEDGADGGGDEDTDEDDDEDTDEVRARVAALGHPDLVVHRLALSRPLGPAAEDDLVAAVSELIGFDPESGVYCLAPALPPGGAGGSSVADDPGRIAVSRAAQRVARVYALPLVRYRCLELSVVEERRDDADPGAELDDVLDLDGYDTV